MEKSTLTAEEYRSMFRPCPKPGKTVRKNKYGAEKKEYNGRKYDSKAEGNYAKKLDWLKKAGEIKEVIPQFKIDITINGVHITNYYVDFKVIYPNGNIEFHEVKGYETPEWAIKWRLAKAMYPEYKFVLIKDRSKFH